MKSLYWGVMSFVIAALISLIDAALNLVFFNFSNVTVLDGLGYWQLFWVNMAVVSTVLTAVGLGLISREFNRNKYLEIRDQGQRFDRELTRLR